MGQILRPDKIGTLQHSAGNIQMIASQSNPAYLTIGGQQYKVTSNLVVALPAMSANTRYQVFAVQSGGVVSLVISQNENSVGPVGYITWKLVGSLYSTSTSAVAFGSFVNIEGTPRSENISIDLSGSGWTVTPVTNKNKYTRDGKYLEFIFRFTTSSAAAALAQINLPPGLTTASSYSTDSTAANPVGFLGTIFAGELAFISAKPSSSFLTVNLFRLGVYPSGQSANANALGNGDLVGTARVEIAEWSNTPIKDL